MKIRDPMSLRHPVGHSLRVVMYSLRVIMYERESFRVMLYQA